MATAGSDNADAGSTKTTLRWDSDRNEIHKPSIIRKKFHHHLAALLVIYFEVLLKFNFSDHQDMKIVFIRWPANKSEISHWVAASEILCT